VLLVGQISERVSALDSTYFELIFPDLIMGFNGRVNCKAKTIQLFTRHLSRLNPIQWMWKVYIYIKLTKSY